MFYTMHTLIYLKIQSFGIQHQYLLMSKLLRDSLYYLFLVLLINLSKDQKCKNIAIREE